MLLLSQLALAVFIGNGLHTLAVVGMQKLRQRRQRERFIAAMLNDDWFRRSMSDDETLDRKVVN